MLRSASNARSFFICLAQQVNHVATHDNSSARHPRKDSAPQPAWIEVFKRKIQDGSSERNLGVEQVHYPLVGGDQAQAK